jgi:1-acyl-sn-glycerol-3-phosphate acyltransferase
MAQDPIRHAGEERVIQDLAPRLLQLVRDVADELRPGTEFAELARRLGLDHSLERDYGLDSLSRAELLLRIERDLGVAPGETSLSEAETPRDLLRVLQLALAAAPAGASSGFAPAPPGVISEASESEIQYPPDSIATLVDVLDWHAEHHGDRLLITLHSERGAATHLTYGRLRIDALAVAAGLTDKGYGVGDAVAIMLPTGSDFFAAFYGALYAGCVPVPLYPPARLSQLEDHLRRIAGILRNAEARVLITVGQAKPLAHLLRAQIESLRAVVAISDLAIADSTTACGQIVRPALTADATAFLQYTSGSTGDPKGVVISHANLLANVRAMWRASRISSVDTFLSWLPLYHDLGLIGACIGSLYVGYRLELLSPLAFLAKPSRWLWAIHRHRATVSAAPNFAYELCLNKLSDAELEGLDLSSWRLAFNGAEPISPGTVERFASRFGRYGFRREAMFTVYGLAEGVLGVTFPPLEREPLIDRVSRAALMLDGTAKPATAEDVHAMRFVSCGVPLPGHEVRVVNAAGHELPERAQGRIQFRGPSATRGYYKNPSANAGLFEGDWLNTGDLGYFAAGELYLTGREKDIIVRRGANIHPAEFEVAVASLRGVRKGGVAVFPATDSHTGTERLVVLAEVRATDAEERRRITESITRLAVDQIGMPPDDIVLAPPRSVLKTSSGKIRRTTCRELYEQGALSRMQRAPWWQLARFVARAAAAQARRATWGVVHVAWACRAWLTFVIAALGAWITTMVLPGVIRRRQAARAWARAAIAIAGIDVRVEGLERLPRSNAVVVANHASYLDSILLTAALPPWFGFAAKRELAGAVFVGAALRKLGAVFVERLEAAGGVEDTAALEARARAGEPLVVFPEGTFRRAPGLLPFKLGAFVVAAHTGAPIIPVALVGTRSLLRAGEWLPRRSEIVIEIGAPIYSAEHDWEAALALRAAARQAILARVFEPDVDTRAEPVGAFAG